MEIVPRQAELYPSRDGWKSPTFGYATDMVHKAVYSDDADGFMRFLAELGGVECEVLISGSVANYAATHGARNCLMAMFADGREELAGRSLEYWLKIAEKPSYGPRAGRLQLQL